MISRCVTQVVVWVLISSTIVPPALLAQSMPIPSMPIPYNSLPGQMSMLQPGQPIITNPEALQPLAHSQAPCPAQSGNAADVPFVTQEPSGGAERLATQSGTTSAMTNQGPGRTRGGGTEASQSGRTSAFPGATSPSGSGPTAGLPTHPGLLSPFIYEQQEQQGIVSGLPGQFNVTPGSAMSIEESFSRFFLLQGMTGQLKQFGYNFFDLSFSGFPLAMDMPIGPDYVVGPEDTLTIHIWNVPEASFNRSYISTVERDGRIFIPQIGSIPVAGSTFAQVNQILHAKLSRILKRFDLHISMGRLRSMKVFVVGEIVRPGAYELSSLATVSHALYAACGPAKSGSLRHIQVVRGNTVVADVDFYQFFLRGDRSQDIRLNSGDTVVVAPIGPVAAIGGPVRRAAIYELKDRTTLPELIELAGGLAPSADRGRCQIFRVEAGKRRVILDVPLESLLAGGSTTGGQSGIPMIGDGDFVRIASVPTQIENAVTLAGAVRAPGPYEFKRGMRLLDLLTSEQLLADSYLDKAELIRTDPLTYETTVTSFSPRGLLQGKEENLELSRLDKVVVSTQIRIPRTVTVFGEVKRPGTYTIENDERLSSVLKRAGGLTSRAFPQGLVFMRDSVRKQQQTEILRFVAFQKQQLAIEAASYSAGALPIAGQAGAQQGMEATTLQLQMQALDQLVSQIHLGRVVLKMESLEQLEQQEDQDLSLEEGDSVTIPHRPQTVTVIGAVRNPTNVLYREDLGVDDYIQQVGGFIQDANEKEIYLVRVNGSAEGGYARARTVSVGDTIIVPERIEAKTRQLPLWQAIASIIGSVALTAAAISVIGR